VKKAHFILFEYFKCVSLGPRYLLLRIFLEAHFYIT